MAHRSLSKPTDCWTERDARTHLDAWQRSGQSLSEFARDLGVTRDRLEWWKRKPGYQAPAFGAVSEAARRLPGTAVERRANLEPAPFVEVKLDEPGGLMANRQATKTPGTDSGLLLQVRGGYRLRMSEGFDAKTLHRVLTVLREVG